ncbi:MAG TPA: Flp pilus assembly protein CpaB [Candidatus Limnocylindria bacterium]
MKRSNRLVILVGVLLAVLAFVGVLFVLNQGGGPSEPDVVQAQVLVATEDIEIGDPVTPEMVEVAEVDPNAVVGTPFTDPSQLTGREATQAVASGGQVSQEVTGQVLGDVCLSCSLLPGEKAIAFQVDRVTGLDFLVLPGDHIDVVLNQRIPVVQPTIETINSPPAQQRFEAVAGLESAPTVKTVLQNKRVLYVSQARSQAVGGEETPSQDGEQGAPPEISSVIIIFAGTDQDAELIKLAQNDVTQVGALTAILRGQDDDVNEATTGVTISLLIERYGVPVPNIVLLQTE